MECTFEDENATNEVGGLVQILSTEAHPRNNSGMPPTKLVDGSDPF
jgi:hypothetical protein